MLNKSRLLTPLIAAAIAMLAAPSRSQTPSNNQDLKDLKDLKKKITVEELIAGAILDSVTAQKIKLDLINGEAAKIKSEAAYDINTFSNLSYGTSEAESVTGNGADSSSIGTATFGASKYFSTGTTLTGSLTFSDTTLEFPSPVPETDQGGNSLSVSVKQNILKDGFGSTTEKNIKAAELGKQANEYAVKSRLENYATQIAELFFNTKKSQIGLSAAKKNRLEQKKLLDIAQILNKRGNTERSDLLEIEASYMKSQEAVNDSLEALENTWNTSILLLGLPKLYKKVPPTDIILAYSSRLENGLRICASPSQNTLKNANEYRALQRSLESSEQRQLAAKESLRPDLSLEFKHSNDNYEDGVFDASVDSFSNKSQGNSIALAFSMPLERSLAKASLFETARKQQLDRLSYENFEADRVTEIENECNSFNRSKSKTSVLEKIHEKQTLRAELDRKRFQLGRLDAFKAIQSSISETSAWLDVELSKLETEASAWRLMHLSGELGTLMQKQLQGMETNP